jgi:hypothetical protein
MTLLLMTCTLEMFVTTKMQQSVPVKLYRVCKLLKYRVLHRNAPNCITNREKYVCLLIVVLKFQNPGKGGQEVCTSFGRQF